MQISFLRHGQTKGNIEKRYVGITEESITKQSRIEIQRWKEYSKGNSILEDMEAVYISPRVRCKETAQILFPSCALTEVMELAECNFGIFEYKNYLELDGNQEYQKWIDSGGVIGFPEGENKEVFQNRILSGWEFVIIDAMKHEYQKIAVVAHGGTIMSVLEAYGIPKREYYQWNVENACGYLLDLKEKEWIKDQKMIHIVQQIQITNLSKDDSLTCKL